MSAVDNDRTTPNNKVTYSLNSGGFGWFFVDGETGEVRVSRRLDKEGPKDEFSLVVVAFDGGEPSQASEQTVIVKVCVYVSMLCVGIRVM